MEHHVFNIDDCLAVNAQIEARQRELMRDDGLSETEALVQAEREIPRYTGVKRACSAAFVASRKDDPDPAKKGSDVKIWEAKQAIIAEAKAREEARQRVIARLVDEELAKEVKP